METTQFEAEPETEQQPPQHNNILELGWPPVHHESKSESVDTFSSEEDGGR